MIAFLKLIRWKNVLIVAITMFAMKYAVIAPIYKIYAVDFGLSDIGFMFLVAASMFLMAGGNVINDYFDRKTDMINRPKRVLVGFSVKRRKVMLTHLLMNVLAVFCGFVAAYYTGKLWLGLLFIFVSLLLWVYSAELKRKIFIGNFVVALLTGLIPFLVAVTEYYAFERSILAWTMDSIHAVKISFQTICGFAVFAFLFNIIREIIKDCEDYEGDIATGVKSIPVVFGKKKANYLISSLTFFSIILILFIWHFYLSKLMFFNNDVFSMFYIYSMIIFPALIIALSSLWGTSKKKYSNLSKLTKFIMITGVIYSIVFSMIINGSIK
ncbi:MAG TPA: geranylgeranylglycerol-phosphate geranylgeranyltransferase [Bacteroidales bacterium]|nr:geranylgeranylglycerol-phosphate geranylgeranyltransferase [Bacteroidales bacterium]